MEEKMSDELKSKQTNEQTINEELSNQNKNNDGFLSNKFICWMVVLNLFLRSMMVILQGVTEIANERPYSGLWILIIPTMIIFFNILLWVSLALSIKNIKT